MRYIAILLVLVAPAVQAQAPSFVEETTAAGITSRYMGEWEYMVGGGVATFDCNTDGRPDMLLAGGEAPATFYRNTAMTGGPLAFVAEQSGLEAQAVTGAYPMEIDGDGITDLILLRVGENLAMRGLGDCRFARANEAWGFDGGDTWSTALAATWETGADWPTIAIGNYIDRTQDAFPWGSCTDNWLHRGASGGFAPPLPLTPSHCALSMLFTDWNRSGTPSLRVSNDREYYKGGQEQMWHMAPGEPPRLYADTEGWARLRIWGMGIASHDLTGDGFPEYFLTSMADNKLQSLKLPGDGTAPKPAYADVALARGVVAQRPHTGPEVLPSTAWHAQFDDVNNDGLVDLFIAKGNVDRMPDFALADPDNLLMQQLDGTFTEAAATAGVASMKTGRGAALVDFNLDGLLDIVVVNRREPAQVFRNTTADPGNWVQITVNQPAPNAEAIGGWIELRCGDRVTRVEMTVGGGHVSGQSGWRHFGLGDATEAEMRILWPDGTAGPWQPVTANTFYRIAKGSEPEVWTVP